MDLIAKNQWELEESDFQAHPVWYPYEEPGDVDFLVAEGLSRSAVLEAISCFDPADSCAFALPSDTARAEHSSYFYLSATVVTGSGRRLVGYTRSHVIGIFIDGDDYILNPALGNEGCESLAEMERRLGGPVLPLTATIHATGHSFDLRSWPPPD